MSVTSAPEQLRALIRDPRYWEHGPDGTAYRSAVTAVFHAYYGASGDGGSQSGKPVFVHQYKRRGLHGTIQNVPAHMRGAPHRAWEGQPNEVWRQQIAREESNRDGGDQGYGLRNPSTGALGRYQMLRPALTDAGWWDQETRQWTATAEAHGVRSDTDFLNNPAAQEEAFTAVMRSNQRQLRAYGADRYVGQRITGMDGEPLTVTESGLAAAAHREGARAVRDYLRHRAAGLPRPQSVRGRRGQLSSFNEIERRLRAFSATAYQAVP